jgi:hypothetical protein
MEKRNKLKLTLAMMLVMGLLSCNVNNSTQPLPSNNQEMKQSSALVFDLGKGTKGANFSIQIGVSDNTFKTKDTITSGKSFGIASYDIYLIKSTNQNGYPANGDPLGTDKLAGPFSVPWSGTTTSLTLKNIIPSGNSFYYIAVRPKDGTGKDLLKDNNGLAISTGMGKRVSNTFEVSPDTTFIVTPKLKNVFAEIQTDISLTNGSKPSTALQDITPVIGEFQVNTYTTNDQMFSSVAMDKDGDFVVVWMSGPNRFKSFPQTGIGQDGNYFGIFAQRYNSNGFPNGPEFQINTTTKQDQIKPSVAMDNDGDFVVVWESYKTTLKNGIPEKGIFAQRYDSKGKSQGNEFSVNTSTFSFQEEPSVAMDANGDFVITWQSNNQNGSGIYARRFNNTGEAQGQEFLVNTSTSSSNRPSVAMDDDGDYVISWNSYELVKGAEVYARRYNNTGEAQGQEFRINTSTTNYQTYPSVAIDNNGDFVVTWQSNQNNVASDDIFARRYNYLGQPQGPEFQVNYITTDRQENPSVAIDTHGNFVIAWESNFEFQKFKIFAQRFNSLGEPQGNEFQVNKYTPQYQFNPSVAMNSGGYFIVTWDSDSPITLDGQDGSGSGVYAGMFSSSGKGL